MKFNLSKGQENVAQVFIFMAVIIITIFIFILLVSQEGRFETETREVLDYRLAELTLMSVGTVTMNDNLWRYEGVEPGKYEQMTAKEVTSLYFSTPGNTVYVGENAHPRTEVRGDLEGYFRYKLESMLTEGISDSGYWLGVAAEGEEPEIIVSNYNPQGNQARVVFPISVVDGEQIVAEIYTNHTESVYSYERETPDVGSP